MDNARVVTGKDVPLALRALWLVNEKITGFSTGATTFGDTLYWNDRANKGYDMSNPGHLSTMGHEVAHVAQNRAMGARTYVGRWISDLGRAVFTGKATPSYGTFERSVGIDGSRLTNSYQLIRTEQGGYSIGDAMWNHSYELVWWQK